MSTHSHRYWRQDFIALGAGALLVLAYAPFGQFWLVMPLLAMLFWTWRGASPKRAAWRGFLFGFGLYGAGVYWVYISLHSYGNAPPVFAAFTTLILVLYLALYPALAGYFLNRVWSRGGAIAALAFIAAFWTLLDWLRSWIFLGGFPWLALGYSQTDSWLAGYAPLLGVYGVGMILLLGAGLLLMLFDRPHRLWPAIGLLALWLGGWGLGQIDWSWPAGEPVRISMIQGNIEQKQKWLPETLDQTLQLYAERSVDVAKDSDIIIWPETAIPLFYEDLDPVFKAALQDQAQQSQTDYLIGAPSGSWEQRIFYNGVWAVNAEPNASAGEFYQKRRLLPFGEYLPLRFVFDLFHRFVDIPMADFTPGADKQVLLQAAGHPVGVSICFEAAFGSEIRRALPAAELLVNVSNDGWFADSLAPDQHLQIARMRAIEFARPMARATNTGISVLIDERGQILKQSPQFVVDTLQGELQARQGLTPYGRLGDFPIVVLSALALSLLAVGRAVASKRLEPLS